jgi:hypothetical protein
MNPIHVLMCSGAVVHCTFQRTLAGKRLRLRGGRPLARRPPGYYSEGTYDVRERCLTYIDVPPAAAVSMPDLQALPCGFVPTHSEGCVCDCARG